MPELSQMMNNLLEGQLSAIEKTERDRLLAHVAAVNKLQGKPPTMEEFLQIVASGWLPNFYAGSELEINGSSQVTAARDVKIGAEGGVEFGPLKLDATFTSDTQKGSSSNVAARVVFERQSMTAAVQNAFQSLSAWPEAGTAQPQAPPAPPAPPATPAGK